MNPCVVVPWLLALAASPDGGSAGDLSVARQELRLGHFSRAWTLLAPPPDADAATWDPPRLGLSAVAAAGVGQGAWAQKAFLHLRNLVDLPPLARLALETRYLEVCSLPCQPLDPAPVRAAQAPAALSARYLMALTRVDPARAKAAALDVLAAAPWQRTELAPVLRADLLAATHAALQAGGDAANARLVARAAWEAVPAEPSVAALLEGMPDAALVRELGMDRALAHMDGLVNANDNEGVLGFGALLCAGKVVEGAVPCPALPELKRCGVAFAVGKAARQSRKYPEAERVLGVVAAACPEQAPKALLHQARAMIAQSGGARRAIKTLEGLAARFPKSSLADDALVLAGETSFRNGNPAGAEAAWTAAASRFPDGDMRDEALWWLAWQADSRGDSATAVKRLDEIAATARERSVPAWRRAMYWSARLTADRKAAQARMQELVAAEPLSFEAALGRGWLARQGVPFLPGPAKALARQAPADLPVPAELDALAEAGQALSRVGLDPDAAVLLGNSALLKAPANPLDSAGPDVWVAERLLALGDATAASQWTRRFHAAALHGVPDGATLRLWRLAYPAAFAAALEGAARDAKLPAALMLALAREESAFDPAVVSRAGAVGLTQVMPATAADEARALDLPAPSVAAMREPSLNARLGAAHLSRHLRRFHGNPALALAAYNAGPGAASRWLQKAPGQDLDRFVETIPITETRGYVKRVLESYAIYRWLRGDGADFTLPEQAQQGLADL